MAECNLFLGVTRCSDNSTTVISCTDIISVEHDRRISTADALIVTVPANQCIYTSDKIKLYADNCYRGEFIVMTVEVLFADNGSRVLKATCVSVTSRRLSSVANPSNTHFSGLTILTTLTRINAIQPVATTFNSVNAAPDSGSPNLTSNTTDTCLGVFSEVVQAARNTWRDRPDTDQMEFGLFGNVQPVAFQCNALGEQVESGTTVFTLIEANYHLDSSNTVDQIIPYGGTYTKAGVNKELTLEGATPPVGYTMPIAGVTAGAGIATYWPLTILGRPTGCNTMRSKRIAAQGIAVSLVAGEKEPTPAEILVGAQELMDSAAAYLAIYGLDKLTVTFKVPDPLGCAITVGDKAIVGLCDLPCGLTLPDTMYINGVKTTWAMDGSVISDVEASNVLDSLSNPLSERSGTKKGRRSGTVTTSNQPCSPNVQQTVSFVPNGLLVQVVTATFAAGYPLAPTVTIASSGVCGAVVGVVTGGTAQITLTRPLVTSVCAALIINISPVC